MTFTISSVPIATCWPLNVECLPPLLLCAMEIAWSRPFLRKPSVFYVRLWLWMSCMVLWTASAVFRVSWSWPSCPVLPLPWFVSPLPAAWSYGQGVYAGLRSSCSCFKRRWSCAGLCWSCSRASWRRIWSWPAPMPGRPCCSRSSPRPSCWWFCFRSFSGWRFRCSCCCSFCFLC